MEKKIKKLQVEIDELLLGAETKVENIKSKTKRASGGIKRQAKGYLVEKVYSKIINFCLNETKSNCSLINKMGNLPKSIQNRIPILKTSENYINLKKLKFSKDEEKAGYEDKFDGFIIENNKIKMVIEYKAYSELTMLKRCLVDAMIAQNYDNEIKYCLCLLQSQISSKERLISYNAHSLMDYFFSNYSVNADILILVKEPRKVNEDIIKKKYKTNYNLLENIVNYFIDFVKPL